MEVTVAATLWGLFSAFLIFPLLGLPRVLHRAAGTLLAAELVAFGIWHFGSEGCAARPPSCGPKRRRWQNPGKRSRFCALRTIRSAVS